MAVSRTYRLRVYDTAGSTVELTILADELADVPVIPSAVARPLDGRTEAQSWAVTMRGTAVLGDLADADGRPDLGGRLADWSEADDGGALAVVWTGRLRGLAFPDPATASARLEDERWVERRATIFTTNQGTIQLYPPGPSAQFGGQAAAGSASMTVGQVDGADAIYLIFTGLEGQPLAEGVPEFIMDDVVAEPDPTADQGNFVHTRLFIGGTEREIITFSGDRTDYDLVRRFRRDENPPTLFGMWVHWPSHGYTGANVGDVVASCVLKAPTAPPTEAMPLLLGGETGIADTTLIADIFDGDHGAEDEGGNPVTVRYDAAALAALPSLPTWWSIEAPQNMARWLERSIYLPRQWVPTTNADGEVAPTSFALQQDVDPDTLTTLDAGNASLPFPEWDYDTGPAVNRIAFTVTRLLRAFKTDEGWSDGEFPSSMVRVRTHEDARNHDTLSRLRVREKSIEVAGYPRPGGFNAKGLLDTLAREFFERRGDGSVTIPALDVLASVTDLPGALVKIDHDSLALPNLTTNAQSGTSIWQILKRDRLPSGGFRLELDYAGPALQPLAAPTVAIAQNAANPATAVDVTLSALPTGAGYLLELDRGEGAGWEPAGAGDGAETVTITGLAPNTLIQARALSTAPHRSRSEWSTTASVTTASAARLRLLTLEVDDDGSAEATWEEYATTAGVRLEWTTYPTGTTAPAFSDSADVDATDRSYQWPAGTVAGGYTMLVQATPYPTYSGGAASGTAGTAVQAEDDLPVTDAERLRLAVRPLTVTETERTFEVTALDPTIAEVWPYPETVPEGTEASDTEALQNASGPSMGMISDVSTGVWLLEVDTPAGGNVTFVHLVGYSTDLDPAYVLVLEVPPLDPEIARFESRFEESADGSQSTLYLTPIDPLDTVTGISLYLLTAGVLTGPHAMTLTAGVYEYTFDLDRKHNVIFWGEAARGSDAVIPLGPWTADSNKAANVLSLSVAYDGSGGAVVTVGVDTDTASIEWSDDDGASWTPDTVADGEAVFPVTQTTSSQTILVRGINAAAVAGEVRSIDVEAYVPPASGASYFAAASAANASGSGFNVVISWTLWDVPAGYTISVDELILDGSGTITQVLDGIPAASGADTESYNQTGAVQTTYQVSYGAGTGTGENYMYQLQLKNSGGVTVETIVTNVISGY